MRKLYRIFILIYPILFVLIYIGLYFLFKSEGYDNFVRGVLNWVDIGDWLNNLGLWHEIPLTWPEDVGILLFLPVWAISLVCCLIFAVAELAFVIVIAVGGLLLWLLSAIFWLILEIILVYVLPGAMGLYSVYNFIKGFTSGKRNILHVIVSVISLIICVGSCITFYIMISQVY